MRSLPLLAALVAGCSTGQTHEGIAVGNPGNAGFALTVAEGEGFVFEAASAAVDGVTARDCDGRSRSERADRQVDLLGDDPVAAPAGTWCSAIVAFTGQLQMDGTWANSLGAGTFELQLAADDLALAWPGGLELADGDRYVLELASPGWLDAELLALADGEHFVAAAGDGTYEQLLGSVHAESALFEDDGDGQVGPQERSAGPVVVAAPAAQFAGGVDSSQAGAGCSAGGRPPPVSLGLLVGALARVRRRPRSRQPGAPNTRNAA